MSIIERAISKLQADGQLGTRRVFGQIVEGARQEGSAAALRPLPTRLISIDQAALRSAGLLPPEHQERQIANQYRQIKRPLIANALGRGGSCLPDGQLIMVASGMPGEGKTFTAINLAFSMAMEQDVRVVLVDADVAKPQISKMLGASDERGLLDALTDPAVDAEQLILPTDVPNLYLLPAGKRSDNATELIASERMARAMRNLASRDPARIVLFDSPPLLLTTESQALAHVAGQIVVIVRADHTQQQVLLDALSHLPERANVFLVLNQSVSMNSSSYYYGYGAAEGSPRGEG